MEAIVTETLITALHIDATTVSTQTGVDRALIDVLALICHPDLLVSGWTDAHEGSDEVLALVLAVVRWCGAFVYIYAVSSVRSQSVSVRTDTPEGTRRIVTPEGALVANLETLVHILADLVHARSETLVAETLEASVDIRTGSVTTYVLDSQTLVVVDATSATRVQDVSRRTLAPERAISVYALPTGASVRHEEALV